MSVFGGGKADTLNALQTSGISTIGGKSFASITGATVGSSRTANDLMSATRYAIMSLRFASTKAAYDKLRALIRYPKVGRAFLGTEGSLDVT